MRVDRAGALGGEHGKLERLRAVPRRVVVGRDVRSSTGAKRLQCMGDALVRSRETALVQAPSHRLSDEAVRE